MASSTAKLGLAYNYLLGENGWKPGMDENMQRLDGSVISSFAQDRANTSLLTYAWLGGWDIVDGLPTILPAGTISLPNNVTRYIERDTLSGVVYAVSGSFSAYRNPMAVVTTAGGAISTVQDARVLTRTSIYPILVGEVGVVNTTYYYDDFQRYGVKYGIATSQHDLINNGILSRSATGGGKIRFKSWLGSIYVAQSAYYTVGWQGIRVYGVNNVTIVIEQGVTLRAMNNSTSNIGAVITIMDSSNIRITGGGTIVGEKAIHSGPVGEGVHCIAIAPSTVRQDNIEIDHLKLMDAYGDGLFIGINDASPFNNQQWNYKVKVHHLWITGCRRQSISVCNVKGLTLNCLFLENTGGTAPGAGIDFEPFYGLTTYPTGVAAYAPVEDVTGSDIYCEGNVYGIVYAGGTRRANLGVVSCRNNTTYDIYTNGDATGSLNQLTNQHNSIDTLHITHDEAVVPGTLPIGIVYSNGSRCSIGRAKLKGRMQYGAWFSGSGSNFGKHTLDDFEFEADSYCLAGIYISNTSNENHIGKSRVWGAQQSLWISFSCSDVVIADHIGADSVSTTLPDIWFDGANKVKFDVTSLRAGFRGVQIDNSTGWEGKATVSLAQKDGCNINSANANFKLDVNLQSNSQLANNTYDNLLIGASNTGGKVTGYCHPGTLANKSRAGVFCSAPGIDLLGLDVQNGHSSDVLFATNFNSYYKRKDGITTINDASVTADARSSNITQIFLANLTANRDFLLPTTHLHIGCKYIIPRKGLGAFTLRIWDGTTTYRTIAAATAARSVMEWDGATWVETDYHLM